MFMLIYMKKYNLLFMYMYLFSPFLILFVNNYFSMWIFMELNLILFLVFLIINNKFLGDKVMKYYFMSSLSSMIFIFFFNLMLMNFNLLFLMIINLMLTIKLGIIPFHSWFIDLMMGLDWLMCFFLSTWQKIIPMILIYFFLEKNIILLTSLLSSFLSITMSLNQIFLKKLMGFSSINHMSWMLISIFKGIKLWSIYFTSYSLITFCLMMFFLKLNLEEISSMFNLINSQKKMMILLSIFSLGGIPPMFGFLMKFLFMTNFMNSMWIFITLILICFSLIFLFMYIRLTLSSLFLSSYKLKFFIYTLNFTQNFNLKLIFLTMILMNLFIINFWWF